MWTGQIGDAKAIIRLPKKELWNGKLMIRGGKQKKPTGRKGSSGSMTPEIRLAVSQPIVTIVSKHLAYREVGGVSR